MSLSMNSATIFNVSFRNEGVCGVFFFFFTFFCSVGHSGSFSRTDGSFMEYMDITSVMSMSLGGTSGWKGLSAVQLYNL